MMLQVTDIRKEFQGVPVLTGVTFHSAAGERVGLVGVNGSGKSTLLKILVGSLEPDGGSLRWLNPRLRRAYLSQEARWDEARPLDEQVAGVPRDLLFRCGVTEEMLARPAGSLSGGQKTRAALARALAGRPDLLLLDEPTNHLDTEGLEWLERTLIHYRGTILVVSHDRYFLDRVVGRILELAEGRVKEYAGNYSAYARAKQMEQERAEAEYQQFRREKARLEEAMRRQMAWAESAHRAKPAADAPMNAKVYMHGQAKAHARVAKTMAKRLERIEVEKPKRQPQINFRLEGAGSLGRNLLLAQDLGFSYDGKRWVFRRTSFFIQRGDRVAVVGPNGSGKTTLLRLMLGHLEPTEGQLYRSPMRVGYLAQELEDLDPRDTVLEAATGNSALDQAHARTVLGCLLFRRDAVLKRVAELSGGEKVRLALARLLLSAPDLLVLDEPTNGLDLLSRERVEEVLQQYPGTLILVSHDRYLLQRTANRVFHVKSGQVVCFSGTYQEYLERREGKAPPPDLAAQRLLLETRLARLSADLANPPADPAEVQRLNEEFIRVSRELRSLDS